MEKHKDDPLFAEFMETHARGNKSVWSNETLLEVLGPTTEAEDVKDDWETAGVTQSESQDVNHESGGEEESICGDGNIAKKQISDLEVSDFHTCTCMLVDTQASGSTNYS